MNAIILAGGFGTRLRSVIGEYPKPMAPVGDRPFLEYILDWLIASGVREVTLAVAYRWKIIADHFGDRYKGITINYSIEKSPLGTGGALKLALERVKSGEQIAVVNGDTYFPCDLTSLLNYHRSHSSILTVATFATSDSSRFGSVTVDRSGTIKSFKEKSTRGEAVINSGVYICDGRLEEVLPLGASSFEDFMELNCVNHEVKALQMSSNFFIDIGVPKDYEFAKRVLN